MRMVVFRVIHRKLGSLLVRSGVITKLQLEVALNRQAETGERLGGILISCGFATEAQILKALSSQLGVQSVDLSRKVIPAGMRDLIPEEMAREYSIVPVTITDKFLYVAMADPLDRQVVEKIREQCAVKVKVVPMVATKAGIMQAIDALYLGVRPEAAVAENESVVSFMNMVLEQAAAGHAVDVRMTPDNNNSVSVKFQVDGVQCAV